MKVLVREGLQSFSVEPIDHDFFDFLAEMHNAIKEFTTYRINFDKRTKRVKTEVEKIFYVQDTRKNRLYFPNTFLNKFLRHYENNSNIEIEVKRRNNRKAEDIEDVEINKEYIPRDYQEIFIKGIVNAKVPRVLIDLQTGKGKSFISTYAMVKRKKRFAFLILPGYIEKWILDIERYTNVTREEILVIVGRDGINGLINMSEEELAKYKIIMFSLTSMREYVNNYLDINEEFVYDLEPDKLLSKIKVEAILNDETHQEFHNVYNIDLLLNPTFFLGLSATLIPNNRKEERIQHYFFAPEYRLSNIIEYDKYIDLIAMSYELLRPKSIKAENKFGYNHNKFEDNLLKRKMSLKAYLDFITNLVKNFYMKDRVKEDKDKCIIFASTVKMCEIIRDHLRNELEDVNIEKYTGEDKFETLLTADIIVSTLGSAGTAVDIPNLITVIQTVLVSSAKINIQALGRLRKLKGKKVKFIYIYAENMRKHVEYHKKRIGQYNNKVQSFSMFKYNKPI